MSTLLSILGVTILLALILLTINSYMDDLIERYKDEDNNE